MKLPEPVAVITGKLGDYCSFMSSETRKGDRVYSEAQVKAMLAQAEKDLSDSLTIVHMSAMHEARRKYEPALKLGLEALEELYASASSPTTGSDAIDAIRKVLG